VDPLLNDMVVILAVLQDAVDSRAKD